MGRVVTLDDVTVRYGSTVGLGPIDLTIPAGALGVIGVNGAGKSTFLRLLAGHLRPSCGVLEGVEFSRAGYMPQTFSAARGASVQSFLAYVCWLKGIGRRERASEIERALAAVDISDSIERRMADLSGGMHRRILFAQALLGDPKLVLLDEPTTGLDPEQRVRMRDYIKNLSEAGRTIVLSSHVMEDIVGLTSSLLMLEQGRIAYHGDVARLAQIGQKFADGDARISAYEAGFMRLRAEFLAKS